MDSNICTTRIHSNRQAESRQSTTSQVLRKEQRIDMEDLGQVFVEFGRRYSDRNLLTSKSVQITSEEVLLPRERTIRNGNNKGHPYHRHPQSYKTNPHFCIEDPYSGMDVAAQTNKTNQILRLLNQIRGCRLNEPANPRNLSYVLLRGLWDIDAATSRSKKLRRR
eukprot:TRINITY_DN3056_c0_g3_i2.p2 TRINITY_DN3056_c0_g3~~TRINITY_DN3056_c0_g3_i2.p2  ORF type:complete len:165 (+),score=9.11 TRINITY_DN3056_c0_g3_i2:1-495(+)